MATIGVKLNIVDQSPALFDATDNKIIFNNFPGISASFFGWGNVDQYFVADYPFYGYTFNLSHYFNAEYDNLIKKVINDANPATALAEYKQLAIVAARDAFDIDLATRPYVYVYSSQLKGVNVDYDGIAKWAAVSE